MHRYLSAWKTSFKENLNDRTETTFFDQDINGVWHPPTLLSQADYYLFSKMKNLMSFSREKKNISYSYELF